MLNPYKLGRLYRDQLLHDVIPFWQRHSMDAECGGYFTCLDRTGGVFDTEKYVWLQARQVWTFSMLYNRVEKRPEWLEVAQHGATFLRQYGRNETGAWYYALDRQGRPLMQPFSIFSDGFAAMAFSEYARASGDAEARQIAAESYQQFLERQKQPKGRYSKAVPGARSLMALSLRMIHLNMLLEMAWQLEDATVEARGTQCLDEIMTRFLDTERNILFENVAPDGSHPDCPEGRMINPGHGIEVLWMVMAMAGKLGRDEVVTKAIDVLISTLEYGWDEPYGGIIYRRDSLGKPLYQIEWDQKMWWCHAEALVALGMACAISGREDCQQWLARLHEYIMAHYVDPDGGEWFGYLNRRGERILDLKGGRWKGCFHVPRALYLASEYLLTIKS